MTMNKSSFLLLMLLGVSLINQSVSYGTKLGPGSYSQSFSSSSASASASSYSSSSSYTSGDANEIGKLPIIGPIPVANSVATASASAGSAGAVALAGGSTGQPGGGSYFSGSDNGEGNLNFGTYSGTGKIHSSSAGGSNGGSYGAVIYQNKGNTGGGSYIIGGISGKQPSHISGSFVSDGGSVNQNQDKAQGGTYSFGSFSGNKVPSSSFGQLGGNDYYNKEGGDDGSYKKYPGDDGQYKPQYEEGSYSNTGSSTSSVNNYKGTFVPGSPQTDTSFEDKYFQSVEEDKPVSTIGNQQTYIQGNYNGPQKPCCKSPTFPGPNGSIFDFKVPPKVNTVTSGQGSFGFVNTGTQPTSPPIGQIDYNQNKAPKPCCKGPFPGPVGSIHDFKPAYAVGTGVKVPHPVQPPTPVVVPTRPAINFPGPQGSIHTGKPVSVNGNQGYFPSSGTQFIEKIPTKPVPGTYKPELNFPGSSGSIHTSKPSGTNVNFQGNNQGGFTSTSVQSTQFQEKIPNTPFQHGNFKPEFPGSTGSIHASKPSVTNVNFQGNSQGASGVQQTNYYEKNPQKPIQHSTYRPIVNFPGSPGSIFSSKPVDQNVNTGIQSNVQSSISSSGTDQTQFGNTPSINTDINVADINQPIEPTIDFSGIYTSKPVSENTDEGNIQSTISSNTNNQTQGSIITNEVTTSPNIAPSLSTSTQTNLPAPYENVEDETTAVTVNNVYQSNTQSAASSSSTYQAQTSYIACTEESCTNAQKTPQINLQAPIFQETSTTNQPQIVSSIGPVDSFTQPQSVIVETENKQLVTGSSNIAFGTGFNYNIPSSENVTPASVTPLVSVPELNIPSISTNVSGMQGVEGTYVVPEISQRPTSAPIPLIHSPSPSIKENINQQNSFLGEKEPEDSLASTKPDVDRIHFIGSKEFGSSYSGSYANSGSFSGGNYGGSIVKNPGLFEGPRGNPFQDSYHKFKIEKTSENIIPTNKNFETDTINRAPLLPTAQPNFNINKEGNAQASQESTYDSSITNNNAGSEFINKVTTFHSLPTKITYLEEKVVPQGSDGYIGQDRGIAYESHSKKGATGDTSNSFVVSGSSSYGGVTGEVRDSHFGGYAGHVVPCKIGCKTSYRHYSNAVPSTETKKYVFHISTFPKTGTNSFVNTNGVTNVGGTINAGTPYDHSLGFETGGPSYVHSQFGSFGSTGKTHHEYPSEKAGGFLSSIFLGGGPSGAANTGSYYSGGGIATGGSYSKASSFAGSSSFASASSGAYSSGHY